MGRCKDITPRKCSQIVVLEKQKLSHSEIAAALKVSKSTVTRVLAKNQKIGTPRARRPGRTSRVTSAATDRLIHRMVVANPTLSSTAIAAQLPTPVSSRTVRRRLFKDFNLRSRRPAKKAKLSAKNVRDRLTFCRKYKNWTAEDWKKVMFSDESTFSQFSSYVRHVRRPANHRYNLKYVVPTVKQAPTTMVWACFSSSGRGAIWFMPKNTTINGNVYLSVLQDNLQPHMDIQECTIFQHDGAPCHRTAKVSRWIADQGIEVLGPWPGSSPDLNPIENLWTNMKQKVAQLRPTSAASLVDAIKRVWTTEITVQYCESLVSSVPTRIKAVLDSKGQYTKY